MNRRNFLRGILGSVLAAPLLGVAKAFGIGPPMTTARYVVDFDVGSGSGSFLCMSMWGLKDDGLWHCLHSRRIESSPVADLADLQPIIVFNNKPQVVVGERPEPQTWLMSNVMDPTDWSYTGA